MGESEPSDLTMGGGILRPRHTEPVHQFGINRSVRLAKEESGCMHDVSVSEHRDDTASLEILEPRNHRLNPTDEVGKTLGSISESGERVAPVPIIFHLGVALPFRRSGKPGRVEVSELLDRPFLDMRAEIFREQGGCRFASADVGRDDHQVWLEIKALRETVCLSPALLRESDRRRRGSGQSGVGFAFAMADQEDDGIQVLSLGHGVAHLMFHRVTMHSDSRSEIHANRGKPDSGIRKNNRRVHACRSGMGGRVNVGRLLLHAYSGSFQSSLNSFGTPIAATLEAASLIHSTLAGSPEGAVSRNASIGSGMSSSP